jgi:hypothetical protein
MRNPANLKIAIKPAYSEGHGSLNHTQTGHACDVCLHVCLHQPVLPTSNEKSSFDRHLGAQSTVIDHYAMEIKFHRCCEVRRNGRFGA